MWREKARHAEEENDILLARLEDLKRKLVVLDMSGRSSGSPAEGRMKSDVSTDVTASLNSSSGDRPCGGNDSCTSDTEFLRLLEDEDV